MQRTTKNFEFVLLSEFEHQLDAHINTTESVRKILKSISIPNVSVEDPHIEVNRLPPLDTIRRELFSLMQDWTRNDYESDRQLVMFEVNPLSNKTLVLDIFCHEIGSRHADKFIVQMLKTGLHICLGTDNDGIWPIGKCSTHKSHTSVAYEYCTAFKAIQTFPGISTYDRVRAYRQLLQYMTSPIGWFRNPETEPIPHNLFSVKLLKRQTVAPINHYHTAGDKEIIAYYNRTVGTLAYTGTAAQPAPQFYTGSQKECVLRAFSTDPTISCIVTRPDEKSYFTIQEDVSIQTEFSSVHVTYVKYRRRGNNIIITFILSFSYYNT